MKKTYGTYSRAKLSELVKSSKRICAISLEEAAITDSVKSFPKKTLVNLKSHHILTASIPKEYGGHNLGLISGTNQAMLTILKNIGKGNLVMGRILEGHINAQLLINQYGSEKQKRLFAKDAFDGRLFGVWNTQADDGTFLSNTGESTYQLSGSKTFATGAGYVTRPIVTASTKKGAWQMCIVPLDKASVKINSSWWDPMGMKSSRSFKISFSKTVISKINWLGKAGEYYQQPYFCGGAVRFAAVQLGAAELLLDETVTYLAGLKRTHDPFQKMRVGQMAIAVETGNHWITGAALRMDQYMQRPNKKNAEQLIFYANMTRIAIEQICTEVMQLCVKCIGARGLNKPYHFERIIRDLTTYLRQPSPDAVLADVGNHALNSKIKS